MKNKDYRIGFRCSKVLFDMLLDICSVTGKTKTEVIEDLIRAEHGRDVRYKQQKIVRFNQK